MNIESRDWGDEAGPPSSAEKLMEDTEVERGYYHRMS